MKEIFTEIWEDIPMITKYLLFFLLGILMLCTIWFTSCSVFNNLFTKHTDASIHKEVIEDQTRIDITPAIPGLRRR